MTKIQEKVLRTMLGSGKRAFTRDELMSLVGEFVSSRTMRGLQIAGIVTNNIGADAAGAAWTLTTRGIAEAEAVSNG